MKYALLRGLLVGIIAAAGGLLVAEALIRAAMFFDGSPRTESDNETHPIVAAWFGIIGAGVGYATHPLAKPFPQRWTKWIDWLFRRSLLGAAVGSGAASMLFYAGVVVGVMLGVQGDNMRLQLAQDALGFTGGFTVIATSAAAYAASVVGAVLAPSACEPKDIIKRAAWTAIFGAIAGAWLGAGAGLVVLNLDKWQTTFRLKEEIVAVWLAIGAGVASGIAAAIVLRMWRNR